MSVTDKQYADFVDRVVECREAEDRAKADTKQLYGEISDAGEDKAAIGILVRELRLTAKQQTKANFRDAAVEDGRGRYQRGKASHVRAREAIPEHDADGVIIEPAETPKETQGRASTNDEPSPEAGPQAQASHSQGTGAGTLADREARSTGEAASADLPTHSEPASVPPVLPTVVAEAGDRSAAFPPAAAPVVDRSRPNPWCLDPEECGLTSWDHFCLRCQRLKAERQSVGAVQ